PERAMDVLKKALSRNPTSGYWSCREFLRALEQAVAPELGRTGAATGMPFGGSGTAAGATGNDTMVQRGGTEGSAAADPYSSKTRVGDPTARPLGWRDKGVAAASPAVSAPHQQRRKALKMMLMVLALPVVAVAAFAAFKPFVNSAKTDNGHSSKDSKEKDGDSSKEKPSDIAL